MDRAPGVIEPASWWRLARSFVNARIPGGAAAMSLLPNSGTATRIAIHAFAGRYHIVSCPRKPSSECRVGAGAVPLLVLTAGPISSGLAATRIGNLLYPART